MANQSTDSIPLAVGADYQLPPVRANFPDEQQASEWITFAATQPAKPPVQATSEQARPLVDGNVKVSFVAPSWMVLTVIVVVFVSILAAILYARKK